MKLARKIDRVFILLTFLVISFIFGLFLAKGVSHTFADTEGGVFVESEEHFVIFFDHEDKLIVKTKAKTVGEAIERAKIAIYQGDIVEPALDTVIDGDDFPINIRRARPVVIKDGKSLRYYMSTSFNARNVVEDAGISISNEDEVVAMQKYNFLEVGATDYYEIIRKETPSAAAPEDIVSPLSYPLTARMGRNRYLVEFDDGNTVERQETYYDLPMYGVMAIAAHECGVDNYYEIRNDGVKVDRDGYVLVAANLEHYPRCSVVETSLGLGRVYDTGTFAESNPEQFDIATDWTNRNGR